MTTSLIFIYLCYLLVAYIKYIIIVLVFLQLCQHPHAMNYFYLFIYKAPILYTRHPFMEDITLGRVVLWMDVALVKSCVSRTQLTKIRPKKVQIQSSHKSTSLNSTELRLVTNQTSMRCGAVQKTPLKPTAPHHVHLYSIVVPVIIIPFWPWDYSQTSSLWEKFVAAYPPL